MKPNTLDRTVEGNLPGERITMGFAKGAEKHLMGMMASMYSNIELAIIREYSTNAYDSHVEAGNSRPIEVTTPSALKPYLIIKDFGVGMDRDDITRTYSQYGASTKRGSNAFNGMLGIGSKSALAYSGQFTVIAVKDGVKITVAVSRDEDGSNTMVPVSTDMTREPNGVEISIPAKGGNTIQRTAAEFFRYWPKGSVLVDGAEPARPQAVEGVHISDSITLIHTERYGTVQSVVVMGNVPYPAGDHLSHDKLGIPYGYGIVVHVPIGAVDFAPSREALMFSKHTTEALDRVRAEFKAGIVKAVQAKIEKANTPQEAVKAVNEWAKLLGPNRPATFRHRGRYLPTSISTPSDPRPDGSMARMLLTSAANYRLAASSRIQTVDLTYLDNAVFVTGYDMGTHTATHKKKMLQWKEKNQPNLKVNNFVLVNFPIDTHWIDPNRVIAWKTVNAEVLPRVPSDGSGTGWNAGRLPGSYDIILKEKGESPVSRTEVPGSDIDQSIPMYYLHGNLIEGRQYASAIDAAMPEFVMICLPGNRLAKFQRENPKAKLATAAVKECYTLWHGRLSDLQKAALGFHESYAASSTFNTLNRMLKQTGFTLDDPAFSFAQKVAKLDVNTLQTQRRVFARYGHYFEAPKQADPFDAYPLVSEMQLRYHPKHTIQYMNAMYDLSKGV